MAKPRKQKGGEQPKHAPDEGLVGGEVLHQKICLSIDVERRKIFGFTEIKVIFPESGVIGLHAENMVVLSTSINGEPAEFEFYKHHQQVEDEQWNSVTCASEAAEVACMTYTSSLDREILPNILISCANSKTSMDPQTCVTGQSTLHNSPEESKPIQNGEIGGDSMKEREQNIKLVRVDYSLESSEAEMYFGDNLLCIDNHMQRFPSWFPCAGSCMQRCCYDLELTVDLNFVAVSSGRLLYQILTDDIPPRRTFAYNLRIPVSAGWIALAVAPFEILPDSHKSQLSYLCLPGDLLLLRNTVGFFHTAFSHYEDYLSTPFPFGSYTQVFVLPELLASSMSVGASTCIIDSDVLFDEKIIDRIIDARIKLAHALARQWFGAYIVPESPSDEWLIDGLAGFLTDSYIRHFLGNNEARYRRYKANCSVCQLDITGATSLSSVAASDGLYGTERIGLYGKIRFWKSVAVLQMLEKQMGPEPFRKILQIIVYKGKSEMGSIRALSTREFRHLANKVGNLERPFLKEFFPRWVDSCGCPLLRLGLSYVKRKNILELASMRGSTTDADTAFTGNAENEKQGIASWPGMMSIRVHELDGVYDHPSLPMSGDVLQLLEIQLHSRLASKRFQKPKKGIKLDGSEDNNDAVSVLDAHSCLDSPLLWIRIDPEMEYLSEVHFHQPVQMWINQLEKDRDVVAQSEAISILKSIPHISFSVISALNNLLNDSKAFWRVRVEAAFALAHLSSMENDWAGLLHLIKFYKNRRFDTDIGLPKPNSFQDVPEYFVLEAIPLAIATIRASDEKSPREAVEFILQLLKYNDNNGNPYSDVYWLASLVQSIGGLDLGKQSLPVLPSLLKCIDRLLQFDRLMHGYNGILTVNCIHTLAQIALKMLPYMPVEPISDLIRSFRDLGKRPLKVRLEANRSLLNLEFYGKGLNAALLLFMDFLSEETSIRGQVKLVVHAMHLFHANIDSESRESIKSSILISLLRCFASRNCFSNFILRHHLFCIFQIVAGRHPTLHAVPRVHLQPMTSGADFRDGRLLSMLLKTKAPASSVTPADAALATSGLLADAAPANSGLLADAAPATSGLLADAAPANSGLLADAAPATSVLLADAAPAASGLLADAAPAASGLLDDAAPATSGLLADAAPATSGLLAGAAPATSGLPADRVPATLISPADVVPTTSSVPAGAAVTKEALPLEVAMKEDILSVAKATKEAADTISNSTERRVLKIRVKQPSASGRAEEADHMEFSRAWHDNVELGPTSSVSVDAPQNPLINETLSTGNPMAEEVHSCRGAESRMTASVGSAKVPYSEDLGKELQCTADSRINSLPGSHLTPVAREAGLLEGSNEPMPLRRDFHEDKPLISIQGGSSSKKKKEKKHKEKKRKRDRNGKDKDPEYVERKRQKKEKKRMEKEMAHCTQMEASKSTQIVDVTKSAEIQCNMKATTKQGHPTLSFKKPEGSVAPPASRAQEAVDICSSTKVKIKIKSRTLRNP